VWFCENADNEDDGDIEDEEEDKEIEEIEEAEEGVVDEDDRREKEDGRVSCFVTQSIPSYSPSPVNAQHACRCQG